jgi:hypothetical protein
MPQFTTIAHAPTCYATGVERTCFDVLSELFERDLDRELLRRAQAKTPTERIVWLEEMQAFADEARKARSDEAARATRAAR